MQCPTCNVTLVMADRQGVEIDYCPQCRGVWLDRGELDKIIERTAPEAGPASSGRADERRPQSSPYGSDRDRYRSGDDHHRHGNRKKSLLKDFFDF